MTASIVSVLLSSTALLSVVSAQDFGGGARNDDAFQNIQPVNTTILTEYGSSPPFYPSRK